MTTLTIARYAPNGEPLPTERIQNASWEAIEGAIRDLDRDRNPFVWIHRDTLPEPDDMMEIMGGDGAYWVAISADGMRQRRIVMNERGDDLVDVWRSDQGFEDRARHVCPDLLLVLRLARHFVDHGGFDPSVSWEPRAHGGRPR